MTTTTKHTHPFTAVELDTLRHLPDGREYSPFVEGLLECVSGGVPFAVLYEQWAKEICRHLEKEDEAVFEKPRRDGEKPYRKEQILENLDRWNTTRVRVGEPAHIPLERGERAQVLQAVQVIREAREVAKEADENPVDGLNAGRNVDTAIAVLEKIGRGESV